MPQELPNRYDHAAAQQRCNELWNRGRLWHSEPDGRPMFSIVIPPPNVTGALHLGHALNNTLQDILIRNRRMQGLNTMWMPGTDHAGIATQAVVERRIFTEEKLSRHDLGREKLVERIWKWKDQYEARIIEQLKTMGCSCDWDRLRFTFDDQCARAVRHTFFRMFQQHKIYRGKRLVNWDPFLQTAVSDDEVFHETVKGHFWHFRYPVIDPQPGEPTHVTVATTRPETMLGDTAVAVHPNPAKALDAAEKELREKLSAAADKDRAALESQLDEIAARRSTHLPMLERLRDMAKAGRMVMLPLMDRPIPLVADEWAKPELGSGCVKITPAHDPNDYDVGRRQSLPMVNILNPDGTLNGNAGKYQGLKMAKAREQVAADLDALGLLAQVEDREIELAHSDRSKTPIEPYLADQWFVRMDELAQSAMDAVADGRVQIFPPRYAKGYLDWLGEKRDWPVSRQLWWGHRIPVYSLAIADPEDADDLQVEFGLLARGELGRVWHTFEGNDEWKAGDGTPFATMHVCLSEDLPEVIGWLEDNGFQLDPDVLDTWFSSALWPHSTLGWPEQTPELAYYYPTSVLVTSRDIITLWVARMALTGLFNMEEVPFRHVYIHPKILDRDGDTMSKSKGNGVDPLDVVDKFGSDALRFGLAYITTETQDVRMPVDFECPHCETLIDQTKKNRVLPRIACKSCGQEFGTQWAEKAEDKALPRGAVVSERFELARNFCNKLWNASRFVLMNLEGYTPGDVSDAELRVEDRWLLSRLATVTAGVTAALGEYKFAEATRQLYDFSWDEFCSFYVEMSKSRLADAAARPAAQRVLAHALDVLLRLLHPIVPFITEEIWQLLNGAAPTRGLPARATEASVMIAAWPQADTRRQDAQIEGRFARFQAVLAGLREVRSRQNINPKTPVRFSVRCDDASAELLRPMAEYFQSMAGATAVAWGPATTAPAMSATFSTSGYDVFVDLAGHIDLAAELARSEKERDKLTSLIAAKEQKLSSEGFTSRAPADVVAKERDSLREMQQRHSALAATIEQLTAAK